MALTYATGTAHAVTFAVDASTSSPAVLVDGQTVDGNSIAVLDVPADTPLRVQIVPGGFPPGNVTVSSSGIVSYDPVLEGAVYTGAGSNTLAIVTYAITVDSTDLSGSGGITSLQNPFPAHTITYGLPAGQYRLQGSPGGVLQQTITVDTSGTVSYDPTLEGTWFTGAGTSTVGFVGHPITIDGQQLDGTAFLIGFGLPTTQTPTFRLPVGRFSPRVQPGGRLDLVDIRTQFSVEPDGTIDYDPVIDGLSLAGRGTSTLQVLPFQVTVDATGSTVDTNLSFTFTVPGGATGTFALSVGTFNVNATGFGNIGSFTIDSDGSCSQTEFLFDGGVVNVICGGACADADGDGFGAPGTAGCPGGSANDCDDADAGVSPGSIELPGNIVDEDCDGSLGDCDPTVDWSNHGQYVRCVAQEVETLVDAGVLTDAEGDALINSAARSDIGKRN